MRNYESVVSAHIVFNVYRAVRKKVLTFCIRLLINKGFIKMFKSLQHVRDRVDLIKSIIKAEHISENDLAGYSNKNEHLQKLCNGLKLEINKKNISLIKGTIKRYKSEILSVCTTESTMGQTESTRRYLKPTSIPSLNMPEIAKQSTEENASSSMLLAAESMMELGNGLVQENNINSFSEEYSATAMPELETKFTFKEEPLDEVDVAMPDLPDMTSIGEEIIIKEEKPNIYEIGEPSSLTETSSTESPKNASLCQVCLADGADVDVFQTQIDQNSVCHILEMCTSIKIVQVANIPQFICKLCAEQLMHCNNFRKQFEKSQNILKNPPEVLIKIETENEMSESRFGRENNESINELIKENNNTPKSTLNSKKHIWKLFMDFCADRNYVLNERRTPQELAFILKDWAVNIKKLDRREFKETTFKTMWRVSSRMLQEKYHDDYNIEIDPMKGAVFKLARDALDPRKILQTYRSKRKISTTASKLEDSTKINNFWDENTPEGLQRKFYHIAAVELAWKSTEADACLIDFFKIERNTINSSVSRIEYNPTFSETNQEGSTNGIKSKWLVRNSDINLCAVRLFLKLMIKRGRDVPIKNVFLRPNRLWKVELPNSPWYDNIAVGKNVINGWTKESAAAVGLDIKNRKITNSSNKFSE